MRKPKFRPGPAICDPIAAIAMMMAGEWFYWLDRPKSPVVLLNMNASVLINSARHGRLRLAIPNEEAVKP